MSNRTQRSINQFFASFIAKLRKWLIKIGSPFRISRRFVRSLLNQSKRGTAGFVLPTTIIVTLLVTLLVTVMIARSGDRAKTAANSRVDEVFRAAATPALERARAKLSQLLVDPNLPRATPVDGDFFTAVNSTNYTFGDEIRLQIYDEFDGTTASIRTGQSANPTSETASTVWKFPIDSDGNGRYDTYGLYSILYRTPAGGGTSRRISRLESRARPMSTGTVSGACVAAAVAGQAGGGAGWETQGSQIRKSFFVYAATVPITQLPTFTTFGTNPAFNPSNYEVFPGDVNSNQSFNAIELQQDRARKPLNNNAVWFDGDLELARSTTFRLNGRVVTNGNLMVGSTSENPDTTNSINFYQVSDPRSCNYKEDNAKVTVGGNVVIGDAITSDSSLQGVNFHLFKGPGPNASFSPKVVAGGVAKVVALGTPTLPDALQTVNNVGREVAFNDNAYNQRLTVLVQGAFCRWAPTCTPTSAPLPTPITPPQSWPLPSTGALNDPRAVVQAVETRLNNQSLTLGPAGTYTPASTAKIREAYEIEYQAYFKNLMRKVPFKEVNFNDLTAAGRDNALRNPLGSDYDPRTIFNTTGYVNGSGKVITTPELVLAPPLYWQLPPDSSTNANFTKALSDGYPNDGLGLPSVNATTDLQLNIAAPRLTLPATQPDRQKVDQIENVIGDRILVGNNLPALWLQGNSLIADPATPQYIGNSTTTRPNVQWDVTGAVNNDRFRNTQISTIVDLGDTSRDGYWEASTASSPIVAPITTTNTPTLGGLRVITGAGIYERKNSFLPAPPRLTNSANSILDVTESSIRSISSVNEADFPVVWSDKMPMSPGAVLPDGTVLASAPASTFAIQTPSVENSNNANRNLKGDLRMRASAVYHYKFSNIAPPATAQDPVACVANYYDPTNSVTARNRVGLDDVSGVVDTNFDGTPDRLVDGRTPTGVTAIATLTTAASAGSSINGIVYPPPGAISGLGFAAADSIKMDSGNAAFLGAEPTSGTWSDKDKLIYQANLVFPDRRFVNQPLRTALTRLIAGSTLSLSEQSAIHAAQCGLQILNYDVSAGTLASSKTTTPSSGISLPHGAIKEAAFLDAREVKSLTRNERTMRSAGLDRISGNADDTATTDLEIEQRQPLEIRVTDIDLNLLRRNTATGATNPGVPTDYMLPYTGLVYASRDDALLDLSANGSLSDRQRLSSTDFLLDPTRRPNGIRLISGRRLWRGAGATQAALGNPPTADPSFGEKGLVMVTNDPIYIKGDFNLHTNQEFITPLAADWNNFYSRSNETSTNNLNANFACRPGSSGTCTTGDEWRPATIISDATTIVSANSNDGYRDLGDYDLRNNIDTNVDNSAIPIKLSDSSLARRKQGFYNNNYVTSANWQDNSGLATEYPGAERNTYLANGVTPVQRRLSFPEYGMEFCRKIPLYTCQPKDWIKDGAGTTSLPVPGTTPVGAPRYIAPANERYARRFSFLRYNDIYGDGNMSLVMARSCSLATTVPATNPASLAPYNDQKALYNNGSVEVDDAEVWPMALGVSSGNLVSGYTYPHLLFGMGTPFSTTSRNLYGDVGCPPPDPVPTPTVEITAGATNPREGRIRSIPIYSGSGSNELIGSLPAPVFSTNNGSCTTVRAPNTSNVTGCDDSDASNPGIPQVPQFLYANNGTTTIPIPPAAAGTGVAIHNNFTTTPGAGVVPNPAVYRSFDFTVRVNNLDRAPVPVRVLLSTTNGTATGGAVGSFPPRPNPGGTGDVSILNPGVANPGGQTDFINTAVYGTGGTGCPLLGTAVTQWDFNKGPGPGTFNLVPPATTGSCTFRVAVVRDSAYENAENFNFNIGLPVPPIPSDTTLAPTVANVTPSFLSTIGLRGQAQYTPPRPANNACSPAIPAGNPTAGRPGDDAPQLANNPTPGVPACPSPSPSPKPSPSPSPSPKPTPTPSPTPTPKPSPTPTPTPTPAPIDYRRIEPSPLTPSSITSSKPPTVASSSTSRSALMGAMLPAISEMMTNVTPHVAAAYPSNLDSSGANTTTYNQPIAISNANAQPFNTSNPTAGANLPTIPLIGLETNPSTPLNLPGGYAPPRGTAPLTSPATTGYSPMLPGMSSNLPPLAPRSLWYRATQGGNWLGESWNMQYGTDRVFVASNFSLGRNGVSGGATQTLATPLSPSRLVLPNTACIDTTDPANPVPVECNNYVVAANVVTTGITPNIINLNLPINSGSTQQAASNYLACGFTNAAQRYQADYTVLTSSTGTCPNSNISSSPTNPQAVINDVYNKFANLQATANLPAPDASGNINLSPTSIGSTRAVYVIDAIPSAGNPSIPTNTTLTLSAGLGGTVAADPIYVIRLRPAGATGNTSIADNPLTAIQGTLDGLRVILDNVSPNNVFWLIPPGDSTLTPPTPRFSRLTLQSIATTPVARRDSIIVGNFITPFAKGATALAGPTNGVVSSGTSSLLWIRDNPSDCLQPTVPAPPLTAFDVRLRPFVPNDIAYNVPTASTYTGGGTGVGGGATDRCIAIRGARFLGFEYLRTETATFDYNRDGTFNNFAVDPRTDNVVVAAVSSAEEPIVVPVLQIHSPESTASGGSTMPQAGLINGLGANWTERAVSTTVNAYFVTGNVPSRSFVSFATNGLPDSSASPSNSSAAQLVSSTTVTDVGDSGGGLQNFIRFIENWKGTDPSTDVDQQITILGGFIQNARSVFATAPFSSAAPYRAMTNFVDNADIGTIFLDPAHVQSPMSTYRRNYRTATGQGQAFYAPPSRSWGYDVGLLPQSPDLFALRFSTAVSQANEFLREVDRNDPWVQTLLCATQPGTLNDTTRRGTSAVLENTYTTFAISDSKQRPSTCTTVPTYAP
jgi:hypothetical protein